MKTRWAWCALAAIAGCSGVAGSHGNERPVVEAPVPTASATPASNASASAAVASDAGQRMMQSPKMQRAALAEVIAACAVESGDRPGVCTELCDLRRSPCTDKLDTLERLARSAEPAVRIEAIDVAFAVVRECDCGDPNEQLSCVPKVNLCERLGWYAEALVDALQAPQRAVRERAVETIHQRMPDPLRVVPALRRLLKETALSAKPPAPLDARLAHRVLVTLWRYGTTTQSAREELYAIIAARPSPRLVADALVALAASEHVEFRYMGVPITPRIPADGALLATLQRALGDGDHLVQSAAALALTTFHRGFVNIGKLEPRLAAWRKTEEARADIARRKGPVQAVADTHVESVAGRSVLRLSLDGPFLQVPVRPGATMSVLWPQPGPAETLVVSSAKHVISSPGYTEKVVVLEPPAPGLLQGREPHSRAVAIYPAAARARSMDIDAIDPAQLPAGVNRDGLTALGDVDGDGTPDVAINTCCGGLAWVHPHAEPHPDSKSMYDCMDNGGIWLRDRFGWHRVYLQLPM